jgi:hypothetical protein
MVRKAAIHILLFAITLLPIYAMAADITASLDRTAITEGETVQLILTSHGSVDDDPNFSVLEKDFEIVGRSQQSSYQIINGKASSSKQWVLSLKPRHEGQLKIPSIPFGSDLSPSLRLDVKKAVYDQQATSNQDFILQVNTDTKRSPVDAQIVVTIQLLYSRNFNNGDLSDLNIKGGGQVHTEQLGEPRRFQKTVNGKTYNVYEARYALFPKKTGTLTIEPVRFEAEVGSSYSGLFDPMARQPVQRVRLESQLKTVEILPMATGWKGGTWLPASSLSLNEEWSDLSNPHAGEPITRTITLSASGLAASQLPKISGTVPAGLKAYPDQPVLENNADDQGITGVRREQVAYIPEHGGEIRFPAINLNWWNTRTGKEEVAELPARSIKVAGAAAPAVASTPAPAAEVGQAGPKPATPEIPAAESHPTGSSLWMWLSLAMGAGWLLTAVLLWRRRKVTSRAQGNRTPETAPSGVGHSYDLHKACLDQDRHQFRQQLLSWARQQWPEASIRGLEDIGRLAGPPLEDLLRQIDQHYAREATQEWPCEEIRAAIGEIQAKASKTGNGESLTPLYPS